MISTDYLNICYYITTKCNQKCDYCFRKKYSDPYEPTKNDIDNLFQNIPDMKIHTFFISGGEPTVSPHIFQIIDHLYSRDVDTIQIISNSTNPDFYKNVNERYQNKERFNFHLSFHPEYFNDGILQTYHYVAEKFPNYFLYILLDKRYKDKITSFVPVYEQYFKGKTEFNIIREKNYTNNIMKTTEYTDVVWLKKVSDMFHIDMAKNIIGPKIAKNEFIGKKCCDNIFSIQPNGELFIFNHCFPELESLKHNIYREKYTHQFFTKTCDNKHPKFYDVCKYTSHED